MASETAESFSKLVSKGVDFPNWRISH